MKFGVFLVSFSCCFYLVCSGVFEPLIRTEREEYELSNQTQITDQSNVTQVINQTLITDLSDESLLLILEELDLIDLLAFAESNEYIAEVAQDVFERRYSSKRFSLSGVFRMHKDSVSMTQTQITIQDAEKSMFILRAFGHLIHDLLINGYYLKPEIRNEIERLIGTHCSESLKRIAFQGFNNGTLSALTKPLSNVETLTIDGKLQLTRSKEMKLLRGEALNLNETFPNLRLFILSADVFDPTIFDINFSQIEHFSINLYPIYSEQLRNISKRNMESAVRNLLKNNPTIKTLNFDHCFSMNFVKMASEYLPKLEEFTVNFNALGQYNGEPIQFPNVKKLDISWTQCEKPELISFETIKLMKMSGPFYESIKFIRYNPNVKQFKLCGRSLSGEEISEIVNFPKHLLETVP